MNKFTKSRIVVLFACIALSLSGKAQLSVTSTDNDFIIDFDNTVSGINNGPFAANGFSANPIAGQLDSDGIILMGMSDADVEFEGGDYLENDFTRGERTGPVSNGGLYYRDEAGDRKLMIQLSGADWTPGDLIIRVINNTGQAVNAFRVGFEFAYFNDQDRGNLVELSYTTSSDSLDFTNAYTTITKLNRQSPATPDVSPAWVTEDLSALVVLNEDLLPGDRLFIRIRGNDFSGSLSRDEFSFDNITLNFQGDLLPRKVFINEVVTNPQQDWVDPSLGDSGFNSPAGSGAVMEKTDEWIELYIGTEGLDLEDWRIRMMGPGGAPNIEGTFRFPYFNMMYISRSGNTDITFTGIGDFLLLFNGRVNYPDDVEITLMDPNSNMIDQVKLGGAANEAPTGLSTGASDESVFRIFDGWDTDTDNNDFIKGVATPGATNNPVNTQGPGFALTFDGTDEVVTISDNVSLNAGTGSFTIETWISATQPGSNDGLIETASNTAFDIMKSLRINAGEIVFTVNGTNTDDFISSTGLNINDGRWHHIAATYEANSVFLYVNGIQEATGSWDAGSTDTGANWRIGQSAAATPDGFEGQLDEVRIWSTALTEDEIRNWMNLSLSSNHPQFGSLVSYYRFDQGSGTNLRDLVRGNSGTLVNMEGADWGFSGAAIGEIASVDFDTPSDNVLAITDWGSLSVSVTSGTPLGCVIYYVGARPNVTTTPAGFINLDEVYWGVKVIGDPTANYDVVFNYSDHNNILDSNTPGLAYRMNAADADWEDTGAILSIMNNTLTAGPFFGTEFSAMGGSEPLPVTLGDFNIREAENGSVLVQWLTLTETNNDYFTVERSFDGLNFEPIAQLDGVGNSKRPHNYELLDEQPFNGINYYRLKQTDFDGQFSYSPLKSIFIEQLETLKLTVYPNPFAHEVSVQFNQALEQEFELQIMDLYGNIHFRTPVTQTAVDLPISIRPDLAKGIYLLRITSGDLLLQKRIIRY